MAKLSDYKSKRDFRRTPEPTGAAPESDGQGRFVIHEHHARRLHWDLRLERDGVLVSFAVPHGIPDDPKRNRKAIRTEDHPLEYLDFQGEIPAGSYGAGSIAIWDRGRYEAEKWREDTPSGGPGELILVFDGERVTGRYALFQTNGRNWLIHRMDAAGPDREPLPEQVAPMMARLGVLPDDDDAWAYEIKWDGIRAVAHYEPGRLRLESRNGNDLTGQYPELRGLAPALGSHTAILDGEIVAFDEDGLPSFERLQQRMHLGSDSLVRRRARDVPVVYALFDLLYLDGHSTVELPYAERRRLLDGLGLAGEHWQTPAWHRGGGADLLAASADRGLEGIVAKRLASRYEPGRRSGSWLKIKNRARQEVVIAGWLPGQGRRSEGIGALVVGFHDEPGGPLRYAGRVGSGFGDAVLERLAGLLGPLARPDSPFDAGRPPRGTRFVEPRLVAEVEFAEWTRDGLLRQPAFKGLRDDKPQTEVVAERVEQLPYRVVSARPDAIDLRVGRRAVRLANPRKVLYPSTGFTKRQVFDYYAAIAPVMLPHLAGRPTTMKRYPDGVDGKAFFQKNAPAHRPDWLKLVRVESGRTGKAVDYAVLADLPALLWAANLAAIELHTSLSLARRLDRPRTLVFDLDPGPPAGLTECCQVAVLLRDLFAELSLQSFPKTSGRKGLQLYVPLNTPVTYADAKPFAQAVAELLERRNPELVVSRMSKDLRAGKVLIDWSQNDAKKTTVCVYSLRAAPAPTVSTPLAWPEVDAALASGSTTGLVFEAAAVIDRVDADGDLFAPVLELEQTLPAL